MSDNPTETAAAEAAARADGTATPPGILPALPAEMTIEGAAVLHHQWLTWWAACHDGGTEPVRVDASAVASIDGSGLQLLLSLRRLLTRHDRALVLERPSDAVRRACHAMGAPSLAEAS